MFLFKKKTTLIVFFKKILVDSTLSEHLYQYVMNATILGHTKDEGVYP